MSDSLTKRDRATLGKLERTIEKGLRTFYEVGMALATIREQKLYKAEYETFDAYCRRRWEFTSRRAYQLIDAAIVVENVNNCSQTPASESHARQLAKVTPEYQCEVWEQCVETAPSGKMTADHVERVVTRGNHLIQNREDTEESLAAVQTRLGGEHAVREQVEAPAGDDVAGDGGANGDQLEHVGASPKGAEPASSFKIPKDVMFCAFQTKADDSERLASEMFETLDQEYLGDVVDHLIVLLAARKEAAAV